MSLSRRSFVRTGTTAALLSALPAKRLFAHPVRTTDTGLLDTLAFLAPEDEMRALALKAVDAAKSAGVRYADVRLTRIVSQQINGVSRFASSRRPENGNTKDSEAFGFSVRALVDGYWGFAASPYWDAGEIPKLVQSAMEQAKANAAQGARRVEWEPIPVATGSWATPGIDPSSVPLEEKIDFLGGITSFLTDFKHPTHFIEPGPTQFGNTRTEWFMASTEGAAISQLFHTVSANIRFRVRGSGLNRDIYVEGLEEQSNGWNMMLDAKIPEQIPQLVEDAIRKGRIGFKALDVGRYDIVLDASTTASLVGETFGKASQLDRALGLEANAGGNSYLGPDPMEFLGGPLIAASMINVSANRSMPKGLATVKWDEEGVVPEDFTLVKAGQLVDYQTTREQAPWIKSWYEKQQKPVRSNGCAGSESAMSITMQTIPNLVLQPGTAAASADSLIAGIKRGFFAEKGSASTDFGAKNGTIMAQFREIVNGKLGDYVSDPGARILFNGIEFWKNVTGIGDATSVKVRPLESFYKGQPQQNMKCTVSAVPIAVKDCSIIDIMRRA